MKIVVTGLRGIPGIMGGVETHCEELYPRIVDENHEVIVICRSGYVPNEADGSVYKGVKLACLRTLPGKHLEAFTHTLVAVCYAKKLKADIVHIHAVGPSLMAPLAKILGMKVVVTHHGPDYDRQKWGKLSKGVLRLGEKMGATYANNVIVISQHIRKIVNSKYPKQDNVSLIHNGVKLQCALPNVDYIHSLGLEPNKYVLAGGRFVKEKGFDVLINAFSKINLKDVTLVIAGDADHEDDYSRSLKDLAKKHHVMLTGFIGKEQLAQLYHHARLFVLPSFHEGLPIALLEAMNCGCDVLVSDIPANMEVGLPDEDYFKCGNERDLTTKLNDKLSNSTSSHEYDMTKYDWDIIAQQTKKVYESIY